MSDEAAVEDEVSQPLAPWQPHWVEIGQQLAADRGWHLREHPGDALHVASGDCSVPIDLAEANQYRAMGANATADKLALRAIEAAMETMKAQEDVLNAARTAAASKHKPRSLKQRLLDRIA